jgi:hypothetical protein
MSSNFDDIKPLKYRICEIFPNFTYFIEQIIVLLKKFYINIQSNFGIGQDSNPKPSSDWFSVYILVSAVAFSNKNLISGKKT